MKRDPALLAAQELLPLPPRLPRSHKGDFGHTLVVGGTQGMGGAALLSALGALYTGSGKTTLATHTSYSTLVCLLYPNLMSCGIEQSSDLKFPLQRATVLALGPGLGREKWGEMIFNYSLASSLPTVLDADGLFWLAQYPCRKDNWILTPHHAEAARLLGSSVRDIEQDRQGAVTILQQRHGGVVILKGAETLIKSPEGLFKCPYGNPGMASGGMGDLLTGVIAALIAQNLNLIEAAKTGVVLHSLAADQLAVKNGERGLMATDLLQAIRHLANSGC